jgi:hypothetical protein
MVDIFGDKFKKVINSCGNIVEKLWVIGEKASKQVKI